MDNTTWMGRAAAAALAVVVVVVAGCVPPRVSVGPSGGGRPGVTTTTSVPVAGVPVPVTVTVDARVVRAGGPARVVADVTAAHPSGQVRVEWTLTDLRGEAVSGTGDVDVAVASGIHQLWVQARARDGGSGTATAELVVLPDDGELRAIEDQLLALVNQERVRVGSPALVRDATLAAGARAWSERMQLGGFTHDEAFVLDPGGFVGVREVIQHNGASPGEAARAARDWWASSPGHWAALMGPASRLAGFGVSIAPNGSGGLSVMATGRLASGTR